jgi:hypothetical protein
VFELSDGDVDGRDQEDYRISVRWEGESTSIDLVHQSYEEDSDRVRILNQICAENPLPTYGCLSDEFGRDGINPGSSTGTMYISFGGIFPLGQNSTALKALGLYQYPRPTNMGLREMHTDFEPKFISDSKQTYLTIAQDIGDYTFTLNYAEADGTQDSQQDYNMDVGPSFTPLNFNTVPLKHKVKRRERWTNIHIIILLRILSSICFGVVECESIVTNILSYGQVSLFTVANKLRFKVSVHFT